MSVHWVHSSSQDEASVKPHPRSRKRFRKRFFDDTICSMNPSSEGEESSYCYESALSMSPSVSPSVTSVVDFVASEDESIHTCLAEEPPVFYSIEKNASCAKGPHNIVFLNTDALNRGPTFGSREARKREKIWLGVLGPKLAILLGLDPALTWRLKGFPKYYKFTPYNEHKKAWWPKLLGPAGGRAGAFHSSNHVILHFYWLCLFPPTQREHCRCDACNKTTTQTEITKKVEELIAGPLENLSHHPVERYKQIISLLKLPSVNIKSEKVPCIAEPVHSSPVQAESSLTGCLAEFDRIPQDPNAFKTLELVWYRLPTPFRHLQTAPDHLPDLTITHWPALIDSEQTSSRSTPTLRYFSIKLIGVVSEISQVSLNRLSAWRFYNPLPLLAKHRLPRNVDLKYDLADFQSFEEAQQNFHFSIIAANYLSKMVSQNPGSELPGPSGTLGSSQKCLWLGAESLSVEDFVVLRRMQSPGKKPNPERLQVLLISNILCYNQPASNQSDTPRYELAGDVYDVLLHYDGSQPGNTKQCYKFLLITSNGNETRVPIEKVWGRMYSIKQLESMDLIQPASFFTLVPHAHENWQSKYLNVNARLGALQAAINRTISLVEDLHQLQSVDSGFPMF